MFTLQIIIALITIFLGIRLGGIAIGYMGGLGVACLCFLLGLAPGKIPIDVIMIIISVISAVSVMQVAGGMDYLVYLTEKLLRKNPKMINYFAPAVMYFLTFLAGTEHTAYSIMPVIIQVAKEEKIKPSIPLGLGVIASQIAIVASPISAAVIYMTGTLEPLGISYLTLLFFWFAVTFSACMITAFIFNFFDIELKTDLNFKKDKSKKVEIKTSSKIAIMIFITGIVLVVTYAILISKNIAIIKDPIVSRGKATIMIMLGTAAMIALFTKANTSDIVVSSTFKAGMSACVCILGVAWLGDTLISNHIPEIQNSIGSLISKMPWLLALMLFMTNIFFYSQAATAMVVIPLAMTLHVPPATIIASFPAVTALFVLPTYPTVLAAIQMDDTKSTKIGKYVLNHSFMLPGLMMVGIAIIASFFFSHLIFQ